MAPQTEDHELSDEEVICWFHDAAADERAGRIVRCENEHDLRAFFAALRSGPG
jgi:hypothetical protein